MSITNREIELSKPACASPSSHNASGSDQSASEYTHNFSASRAPVKSAPSIVVRQNICGNLKSRVLGIGDRCSAMPQFRSRCPREGEKWAEANQRVFLKKNTVQRSNPLHRVVI